MEDNSEITKFIKLMKRAALDAVTASKPAEVCFGVVTSEAPLKILVDQKMTLGAAQLILSRNVTDHYNDITVLGWWTDNMSGGSGDAAFAAHRHPLSGRKHIIVHNRLMVGEEVILIRQQGGQKYIVIDRVGDFNGSSSNISSRYAN